MVKTILKSLVVTLFLSSIPFLMGVSSCAEQTGFGQIQYSDSSTSSYIQYACDYVNNSPSQNDTVDEGFDTDMDGYKDSKRACPEGQSDDRCPKQWGDVSSSANAADCISYVMTNSHVDEATANGVCATCCYDCVDAYPANELDCDDSDLAVYPGAVEVAEKDGGTVDSDCDGDIDGIYNAVTATDTDSDGISDIDEGSSVPVDTDTDGNPDYMDLDADGDGILDVDEAGDTSLQTPPVDTDNDGTPDYQDVDSDGDGVLDSVEAGDSDPITPPRDTDSDGTPDYDDIDADGDGILDADEAGDTSLQTPPVDTDNDGTPDYVDTDSDGDTIPDAVEGHIPDYVFDPYNPEPPVDTDTDGAPDYIDTDSDNDGILDEETVDCSLDSDGDGYMNCVETACGTDVAVVTSTSDFPCLVYDTNNESSLIIKTQPKIQMADYVWNFQASKNNSTITNYITNIKTNVSSIASEIKNYIPDTRIGVTSFQDTGCAYSYSQKQALSSDASNLSNILQLVLNDANNCSLSSTTGYESLYQISKTTSALGFRTGAFRTVVTMGYNIFWTSGNMTVHYRDDTVNELNTNSIFSTGVAMTSSTSCVSGTSSYACQVDDLARSTEAYYYKVNGGQIAADTSLSRTGNQDAQLKNFHKILAYASVFGVHLSSDTTNCESILGTSIIHADSYVDGISGDYDDDVDGNVYDHILYTTDTSYTPTTGNPNQLNFMITYPNAVSHDACLETFRVRSLANNTWLSTEYKVVVIGKTNTAGKIRIPKMHR